MALRTLQADARSIVDDEEVSDVILQGSDGVSVRAVRGILAARSYVFRRMLYGEFVEARSQVVQLGFPGAVLKGLIQFCYTDEWNKAGETAESTENQTRVLVGLVPAARYFEIPRLERLALSFICESLKRRPHLSCVIYDEARSLGEASKDVAKFAMHAIELKTKESLLPPGKNGRDGGVLSLSEDALLKVLSSGKIQATELTMFLALKQWVDGEVRNLDSSGAMKKRKHSATKDRKSAAQRLLTMIDLSRIAPSKLSGVVASSGFCSQEQISAAHKAQSLQIEFAENINVIRRTFTRPRCFRPSPIAFFVFGAGVSEVNGVYTFQTHNTWTKSDMWNNETKLFTIHPSYTSGGMSPFYSISILGDGPGSTELLFYTNKNKMDGSWCCGPFGVNDVPAVVSLDRDYHEDWERLGG